MPTIFRSNANGSFSFTEPVNIGGSYDVTVYVEPQSPVQFCVVSNGKGTATSDVSVVQVTCTTPSEQTLFNFAAPADDNPPVGSLTLDNSGNLYGASSGGDNSYGTVFKLAPSNGQWTETVLYTFCQLSGCADGAKPGAGLIWDAAGNLYGTTTAGGAYGSGTAFKLTPGANGSWMQTVMHSFGNGTDGGGVSSALVFDRAGNLYGTTYGGGSSQGCVRGCGTVFELSPNSNETWSEKVLYSFCSASGSFCPDGANPVGGVVVDSAGDLYGTTFFGGGNGVEFGIVFELSPGSGSQWTEKVLYAFQGGSTDGANPNAGVILDSAGSLYGTTEFGYEAVGINNGVVFELSSAGGQWREAVIYGFCALPLPGGCPDGANPYAPVVFDKAGNLYGTTTLGGLYGTFGTVFAITPGTPGGLWAETALYSFQGAPTDGGNPSFGLLIDTAGNLYGVAGGGTNGTGVIFEVRP